MRSGGRVHAGASLCVEFSTEPTKESPRVSPRPPHLVACTHLLAAIDEE